MKRKLLIIWFYFLQISFGQSAAGGEDTIRTGNEFYKKQQFDKAECSV